MFKVFMISISFAFYLSAVVRGGPQVKLPVERLQVQAFSELRCMRGGHKELSFEMTFLHQITVCANRNASNG